MSIKALVRRELAKRKRTSLSLSLALRGVRLDSLGTRIARAADVIAPVVPISVPLRDGTARIVMESCGGRDLIVRTVWFEGWHGFERPLPDLLARLAERASGTFLDVGANTGFYSLIAARANDRLAIYSFEPFPPVFDLLVRNLALNGSPSSIHASRSAVGASNGTADLYVPVQDHGLVETSCSLKADFKDAHSEVVSVPVVTIDEFVSGHGIDDVALIKVDVEGHEHAVLLGAAATVRLSRPAIVFELLPHAEKEVIERFRVEHGYASYRLREGEIVREAAIDFDEHAWNHVMVPEERVDFAEEMFAALPRSGRR